MARYKFGNTWPGLLTESKDCTRKKWRIFRILKLQASTGREERRFKVLRSVRLLRHFWEHLQGSFLLLLWITLPINTSMYCFAKISSSTRKRDELKLYYEVIILLHFPVYQIQSIWGITYFHLELSTTSLNSYFKVKIITLFHFLELRLVKASYCWSVPGN